MGIIDKIVPEPVGGSQASPKKAASTLKSILVQELETLLLLTRDERKQLRYKKFRKMGTFYEYQI